MTDEVADGRAPGERTESEASVVSGEDDEGPWFGSPGSFFKFLHRVVRRPGLVFGGTAVVGGLVLVRQFYAFASDPSEWPGLPSWTVLGGIFLIAVGVGYHVIRDGTTCEQCGAPFSREHVGKRLVTKESVETGTDVTYVEAAFECKNCGTRTTELTSHPEWDHPRC